jgi:hypothetical protein
MMPLCVATAIRLLFRGGCFNCGTTTAATNIDTETTSDAASVSTSSDRNTQSKQATKQEVVEALSKITEEHATPSPPVT